MKDIKFRAQGSLLGVAVGDALGGTLEFMDRNEIMKTYGIHREIVGGGCWELAPGEVTDDTDMTVAVAKGILHSPEDPIESIAEYFVEWVKTEPKDIGNICRLVLTEGMNRGIRQAEDWYETAKDAHFQSGSRSAGNGSLMRTVPVIIAYLTQINTMDIIARKQSAITHYDPIAGECVSFYCKIVREIMHGQKLKEVLENSLQNAPVPFQLDLKVEDIKTSGYVVHTLEAAFNCAYQTDSFEQALVMAVNLGGDADTIGAVTGGLAGAFYGINNIPKRWLERLIIRDDLIKLSDQLFNLSSMEF